MFSYLRSYFVSSDNENPPVLTEKSSTMSSLLKDILKEQVKLNESDTKKMKHFLKCFLTEITEKMRENDPVFDVLFQKFYYTGSFYENLRVKKADEFDIDLVLRFPKCFSSNMKMNQNTQAPCFAQVQLNKKPLQIFHESTISTQYPNCKLMELISFFNDDGYLDPQKLRSWIQGIVDSVKNKLSPIPGVQKIVSSQHGPAKTMYLHTESGKIDIDLVPVIGFSEASFWPQEADKDIFNLLKRDFKLNNDQMFWFLVPKPVKSRYVADKHVPLTWRVHFPEAEKQILHNKGCVKPIIKLVKLLRDHQKWNEIASYYIKTVAIWLVAKYNSEEYWKEEYMAKLFIEFLNALKLHLEKQYLPSFIFPRYNLFECIDSVTLDNRKNRLDTIIRKINEDTRNLEQFFCSKK